ncbi:MAG: 16S rRNA (cytosine(1402)-N(4))-methyltransferase RsmH [Microthrixaceae bacterium]|nr:16S rRNA (cytosine(1402)-N(4))-methyltransferase RsmH [Microthrixaceae bacterium]
MNDFHHIPVLLSEVVELFASQPPGLYVDGTVGGGGHAAAVLQANPGLHLLGIDRDTSALKAAAANLAQFGDRVELVHSEFSNIQQLISERTNQGAVAIMVDLGVSSHQLDVAERGFSYRDSAPLDMKMNRTQALDASYVVNEYPLDDLTRVIRRFGEERYARRIAEAIVAARPVVDTGTLAGIVSEAIPAPARRKKGHPSKKTFQAIRIEVNNELDELVRALDGSIASLAPGGRLAVLSYHSLEDKLVKGAFREAATGGCVCPSNLPCVCGAEPTVRLLRPGAWKATPDEISANRRSKSVRMRAVERLAEEAS